MKYIPTLLTALVLAPLAALHAAEAAESPTKPNLVFILADDLGYECLGCNGNESYKTPHLDELAAGGVRFTHCFVNRLCTPTRLALMTGRYNFRNYTQFGTLPVTQPSFAQMMQDAGYATCIAGKWQVEGKYQDHETPITFSIGHISNQSVRTSHENLDVHFRQEPSGRLCCHPGILGKRPGATHGANAAGQDER
jgi:arylsulfatase A